MATQRKEISYAQLLRLIKGPKELSNLIEQLDELTKGQQSLTDYIFNNLISLYCVNFFRNENSQLMISFIEHCRTPIQDIDPNKSAGIFITDELSKVMLDDTILSILNTTGCDPKEHLVHNSTELSDLRNMLENKHQIFADDEEISNSLVRVCYNLLANTKSNERFNDEIPEE